MAATWPSSGPFNAALWESRMARPAAPPERRVIPPEPPGDHAPLTTQLVITTSDPYAARLRRASRLLRERLNRMEAPHGPLSPQRKRLLSHQTGRLSKIVEKLVIASKRHEEEHRRAA